LESLLIITGTMGSGKTAVLYEASDILIEHRIIHAAIDLDALGVAHLPAAASDGVMWENLRSICTNYLRLGVQRFLVARALEDKAQLELCHGILSDAEIAVCRLTASIETMKRRVVARETGISQKCYVARVEHLNSILDGARLEDFSVSTEERSITEVALEMLTQAGWI